MKYKSVWQIPPTDTPSDSAENLIEIMQEQAQYLENSMNGQVWAEFSEMNHTYGTEAQSTDANKLFHARRYSFNIYNKKYSFRLFMVDVSPFYPVTLWVDEDVLQEAREKYDSLEKKIAVYDHGDESLRVTSDDDLLDTLAKLSSTRKVKFMLYKLRQQSEEAEKKGA